MRIPSRVLPRENGVDGAQDRLEGPVYCTAVVDVNMLVLVVVMVITISLDDARLSAIDKYLGFLRSSGGG